MINKETDERSIIFNEFQSMKGEKGEKRRKRGNERISTVNAITNTQTARWVLLIPSISIIILSIQYILHTYIRYPRRKATNLSHRMYSSRSWIRARLIYPCSRVDPSTRVRVANNCCLIIYYGFSSSSTSTSRVPKVARM